MQMNSFQVGKMHGSEMMECIDACQTCHGVCLETIQHCLKMGGRHAEPAHIRLLMDCVQICQTSADFMIRGSDLHAMTCGVCAEVCRRCAESCQQLAGGEGGDLMQRCADACRMCAESCERMAGHGH